MLDPVQIPFCRQQRSVMLTSGCYAKGELQRIDVTRYDNSLEKCYLV
jgi:hypothetical protein